jgi:hypothetical protein
MTEAQEWSEYVRQWNAVETAKALSEKSSEKSPKCLDTVDGGMIQYAPMKEKGDMA